jgi:hypothetical protein
MSFSYAYQFLYVFHHAFIHHLFLPASSISYLLSGRFILPNFLIPLSLFVRKKHFLLFILRHLTRLDNSCILGYYTPCKGMRCVLWWHQILFISNNVYSFSHSPQMNSLYELARRWPVFSMPLSYVYIPFHMNSHLLINLIYLGKCVRAIYLLIVFILHSLILSYLIIRVELIVAVGLSSSKRHSSH